MVALYFYSCASYFKSELKLAYEEFRKNKKNFEIVLIYDDSAYTKEESYWEIFKTMPWLALPYNDPNNKKLTRIFEHNSCKARLVIFGPHGKFIDPYGAEIMDKFGIRAYPFTCAAAVKLEIEKTRDLRLEMLSDPSTVLNGKDGYKVNFINILV